MNNKDNFEDNKVEGCTLLASKTLKYNMVMKTQIQTTKPLEKNRDMQNRLTGSMNKTMQKEQINKKWCFNIWLSL